MRVNAQYESKSVHTPMRVTAQYERSVHTPMRETAQYERSVHTPMRVTAQYERSVHTMKRKKLSHQGNQLSTNLIQEQPSLEMFSTG